VQLLEVLDDFAIAHARMCAQPSHCSMQQCAAVYNFERTYKAFVHLMPAND
jgi:hypothetical protein